MQSSFTFLIECSLITVFCTFFAHHVSHTVFIFHYAILLFAFSLWTLILKNKNIIYYCFIILISISAFFDKTIIFFVPILLITYAEYLYAVLSDMKKKGTLIKMVAGIFLVFVYSNILYFNLIFCTFSLIVFFYAGMKAYYRFKAKELIQLQDALSEYTMTHEKQQRQLQNDLLKNTEAAVLEERNRISVALHNSIGHTISAAILQLNALQYLVEKGEVQQKLTVLQHSLEQGMTEIRECLHNIHNASFHLEYALQDLIQNTPLKIKYTYNIDTLPYLLKHDIFSIVKECIANTLKHSGASEMTITMTEQPLFYSITVEDNGTGCMMPHTKKQGIGLTIIEETIKKNGGSVRFYTEKGFKVHIIFPKGAIQYESGYN